MNDEIVKYPPDAFEVLTVPAGIWHCGVFSNRLRRAESGRKCRCTPLLSFENVPRRIEYYICKHLIRLKIIPFLSFLKWMLYHDEEESCSFRNKFSFGKWIWKPDTKLHMLWLNYAKHIYVCVLKKHTHIYMYTESGKIYLIRVIKLWVILLIFLPLQSTVCIIETNKGLLSVSFLVLPTSSW